MITASVGFHCPECAKSGRQKVVTARSLATRPIFTQVLIGINAALYLLGLLQGSRNGLTRADELSINYGLYGPAVHAGDWYRVITSGFLHAGFVHLAFNMWALWIIGTQLEVAMGRLRYGVLYGAGLLSGALGVLILDPRALTVGASAAIFGLFGAAFSAQRASGINVWRSGITTIIVLNLLITFTLPGISIGGHVGGLVGGAIVGWLFFDLGPRMPGSRVPLALAIGFGAACFVAALAVAPA